MSEPSLDLALERVAALLAEWPSAAAIIGGIAIVARVRPRFTEDIDVAIIVPDGDAPKLLELLRRHGFDFDDDETRSFMEGGLVRAWAPPNRALGVGLDLLFANDAFFQALIARATPLISVRQDSSSLRSKI
ncbi:MAG: nucleotidyl transferase AbiEii/AbiGii toxin family protein [Deltaproteobacteria bacterium]|nr:nucleotidyl transferase AbiEii/AbiGii toxin family protein [Deltaproteobacteria bacterium]